MYGSDICRYLQIRFISILSYSLRFFSIVELFPLYYITNFNYHYPVHYVCIHSICLTASSLIIYTLLDYHCALAWRVRMWQSNRENGPFLRRPISADSRVLNSGTACEAAASTYYWDVTFEVPPLRIPRTSSSSSSVSPGTYLVH